MDGYGSAIQLGITRPRLILSWNMFEPSKGMYNFELYDKHLSVLHEAGMNPIMTVKCDSEWGTINDSSDPSSSAPPIQMNDYIHFLETFVSRYCTKVQYWQIENEVFSYNKYWNGSSDDYILLLQTAYTTIKKCDPSAKVVLQGFAHQMFLEVEAGNVEAIEIFDSFLNQNEYYDVIDFHQSYAPASVPTILDRLHKEMSERGFSKEIISTEAGDLDLRLFGQHFMHMEDNSIPAVPIVEELLAIPALQDILREILVDGITEEERIEFAIFLSDNPQTRPILERYQAECLVKRVLYTFGGGATTFNQVAMINQKENPVDWFFAMMGLMDSEGHHKPSYYTFKMISEVLHGVQDIQEIPLQEEVNLPGTETNGTDSAVQRLFKLSYADAPAQYIAWIANSEGMLNLSTMLPSTVKVTHFITKRGMTNKDALEECIQSSAIAISNTPVLISEF